jgi:hypothetical protein
MGGRSHIQRPTLSNGSGQVVRRNRSRGCTVARLAPVTASRREARAGGTPEGSRERESAAVDFRRPQAQIVV